MNKQNVYKYLPRALVFILFIAIFSISACAAQPKVPAAPAPSFEVIDIPEWINFGDYFTIQAKSNYHVYLHCDPIYDVQGTQPIKAKDGNYYEASFIKSDAISDTISKEDSDGIIRWHLQAVRGTCGAPTGETLTAGPGQAYFHFFIVTQYSANSKADASVNCTRTVGLK